MDITVSRNRAVNRLLFRQTRANRFFDKLTESFVGSVTEKFLIILLKTMSVILCLDPDYRKNIEGFEAVYVFADKNSHIYVVAKFKNNRLKIRRRPVINPTFTLIFRDSAAVRKVLFSSSFNVLDALLHQEVDFRGNINYLNKFAYMALTLKEMVLSS